MTGASEKSTLGKDGLDAQNAKPAAAESLSSGRSREASASLLAQSQALRRQIQPDWAEEERAEPSAEEKKLFAKQALWARWLREPEKLSEVERESVRAVSTTPELSEFERTLLANEAEMRDSVQKMFIRKAEGIPDKSEYFDFFRDALDGLADILAQQGWLEGEARDALHAAIEKHSPGEDPWMFMRKRMPITFSALEAETIRNEVKGAKETSSKKANRL